MHASIHHLSPTRHSIESSPGIESKVQEQATAPMEGENLNTSMDMSKRFDPPAHAAADLDAIYKTRFRDQGAYRQRVWSILTKYFSRWIPSNSVVLDLGCGYCEFINQVQVCGQVRYGFEPRSPKASFRGCPDPGTGLFKALVRSFRQPDYGLHQQLSRTSLYKSTRRRNPDACPHRA